MSHPTTITKTIELVPSGYTDLTGLTGNTSYPISNGYTNASSTTQARLNAPTSASGHIYYTFTVSNSNIPSDASITSVTASIKARVNNTSRVTAATAQLYTNTTAKGRSTDIHTTTTQTFTMTPGSWTRSELSNLRLRLDGTGSSSTSSKYIQFYGITVTVTYSVSATAYDMSFSSQVSGVTVDSSASEVLSGESWEGTIHVNDIGTYKVYDNNTDVTSQLVRHEYPTGGTATFVPASYTTSGSISGTYYQSAIGKGSDTTSSSGGNNYANGGSSSTAYINYAFNISDIPSNATITAVSCSVKGKAESTTVDSSHYSKVALYVGSNEISSEVSFTSTSDSVKTVTATTLPSVSDLSNLVLRHMIAYYGGNVVGATLSITYTVPISGDQYYYTYSLSNIQADHTIVLSSGSTTVKSFYLKVGGAWKNVAKSDIKIKVANTWKTPSKIYIKMNNTWKEIE